LGKGTRHSYTTRGNGLRRPGDKTIQEGGSHGKNAGGREGVTWWMEGTRTRKKGKNGTLWEEGLKGERRVQSFCLQVSLGEGGGNGKKRAGKERVEESNDVWKKNKKEYWLGKQKGKECGGGEVSTSLGL